MILVVRTRHPKGALTADTNRTCRRLHPGASVVGRATRVLTRARVPQRGSPIVRVPAHCRALSSVLQRQVSARCKALGDECRMRRVPPPSSASTTLLASLVLPTSPQNTSSHSSYTDITPLSPCVRTRRSAEFVPLRTLSDSSKSPTPTTRQLDYSILVPGLPNRTCLFKSGGRRGTTFSTF